MKGYSVEKLGDHIRIYGNGIVEDYYYYTKREAIRHFKEKYKLQSKGV